MVFGYFIFCYQAQSSAVEAWQVMLQQEGQQSEVMSIEDAATLGYFIMVTPGRLVFRTTFGQRHASVKMVSGCYLTDSELGHVTCSQTFTRLGLPCNLNRCIKLVSGRWWCS